MMRIYVSTYGQYNSGGLKGEWLELDNLSYEEYQEEVQRIIEPLDGEEPMIQDFEGFPECFYNESGIDPKLFEVLETCSDSELDYVFKYLENNDSSESIERIQEMYLGHYNSWEEFIDEQLDMGWLNIQDDTIRAYLDYEKLERELSMDYIEIDGYFFRRY
jgi:antirestriction protein